MRADVAPADKNNVTVSDGGRRHRAAPYRRGGRLGRGDATDDADDVWGLPLAAVPTRRGLAASQHRLIGGSASDRAG